jgi:basic membrane protein A
MMVRGGVLVGVLVIAAAGSALAGPKTPPPALKIALLLDPAGRGDRASNDSALAGLDGAKKQGRLTTLVRSAPRPDEAAAAIDFLVSDAPALIVGVGPLYAAPFRAAAARHPHARFLLLDAELPGVPHVRAVTFRADEGGFLAGVVSAVESKRGRVGFVGHMQPSATETVECGWESGSSP